MQEVRDLVGDATAPIDRRRHGPEAMTMVAVTLSEVMVTLHILAAIVGFGTVYLNALYGAQARARKGREGLAIAEANLAVSKVAQYFIYAVFVTGVVLVLTSDGAWRFGDLFVWLSIVLYAVGLGVSHGVMRPTVGRMLELNRELVALGPPPAGATGGPPPQATELAALGKRVGGAGAFLDVLLVVILVLMVWNPT
jgi:hypothetical protein